MNIKRKGKIIEIIGKRPNFLKLFKDSLKVSEQRSYNHPSYDDLPFWEYDDDYDPYVCDYPSEDDEERQLELLMERYGFTDISRLSGKKKKQRKTVSQETKKKIAEKKAKKHNKSQHHNDFEDFLTTREVYFYRDYNNPDNYEQFHSLVDFSEFCESEGIYVDDDEASALMAREVSHCCINPSSNHKSVPSLITDSSYGGLRWSCAEEDEELIESYSI